MEPAMADTPQLARALQLNALALAFSLAHTVADYGVIFVTTDFDTWGVAAYLGVAGAVYGWWGWSMAQAVRGRRAALLSLLALSGIWAVLHGDVPLHPAHEHPGGHHSLRLAAVRPLGGVCDLAGATRRTG